MFLECAKSCHASCLYVIYGNDSHIRRLAYLAESCVGSTLAEFDPANILAKNPAKKPATEVVKESEEKGTVAPNGNLATGLREAKGLSKRTFEACDFSQPCGQISLSKNLELYPSLPGSSSVAGFFAGFFCVIKSRKV